jgi:starch synthase
MVHGSIVASEAGRRDSTGRYNSEMASRSALIIGSEAVPFAKTGGLADVLGALPPALARLGWDVTLVLPRYRNVSAGAPVDKFSISVGGYTREVGFFEAPMPSGARAILVDCPDLYDREELYAPRGTPEYPDNARRFAMLVRAAFEWTARRGQRPSVVHGHDWQAGLAPVYLRTLYGAHPVLAGTPSVFTIHNLAYQGLFGPEWLPRVDLRWDELTIDRLEFWGRLSFLKGGIRDAAIVTTVSRAYADEIQTPEFGFGFDGILRDRRHDLVGILNGIDTTEWDPRRDQFLPATYGPETLEGKAAAKRAVLAYYRLADDAAAMARPLIGMISRMVDQKGFDLIEEVAGDLSRLDATFVVLGTGDTRYQDLWTNLAARHPQRIAARIGFDEGLAHLIEGGADIFLMPSRFEPCGLNQMYSLRYGTLPVVRAVGGLADTVRNYGPGNAAATGFVFRDYTGPALLEALGRALALYREPERWRAVQRVAMSEDNSWDHSAQEYVTMYERAIETRGRRPEARG